tara:strand:+ start:668 stop:847 length:180 start_codon:yes stop_codon:yes gene_type:complete
MSELKDLHERLRVVIVETCNAVGCDNCGLSWNGGKDCSASELSDRIADFEFKELENKGE